MASIINASTSGAGGLISTADASGQLDLQTAGATRVSITPTGEVLIGGTSSLSTDLGIYGGALGTTAGNQVMLERTNVTSANANFIEISELRTSAGADWTTSGSRIQRKIDATWHAYIQFGGTGINEGITFGTGGSTVSANSISERMRIDSAGNVSMTGTLGINTSAATGGDALTINQGGDLRIYSGSNTNSAVLYCDAPGLFYNNQRLVESSLYYRLNSGVAGANSTATQNLFGVGVTVEAGTIYEIEMVLNLAKTAGTTTHQVRLGFGGTATINNISYQVICGLGTAINIGSSTSTVTTTAITTISNTSATASVTFQAIVKGTVSINGGGTFIPQYALTAAPGGAYTTQIGSYVKLTKLGVAGANINVGGWA